jgi:hypothetical protein
MGSGGKSGGASQSLNYYGTIAGAICWGPLDWLSAIIHNGNYLWQGTINLTADVTDLTGSILDPSKVGSGGYLKLYRGTETQPTDPALGGCPYKGTAYIAAKNLFFGENSGTPPNLQIIGGRLPRIDTSIVSAIDNFADDGQVNPIAVLAEILTDERGGAIDISQLDAASWLASAHWCAQDQDHRDATFCSPLFTDQTALRDIVSDLLDPFNGFCRWTNEGLLACNVYEWGVDPGGLKILDANAWTKKPDIPLGDWKDVPTELLVSFIDRAYEYQTNTVLVPNERAAQIRQVTDQKTLDRKHVTRIEQAHRQATEYNRRIGTAPSQATIIVRQPVLADISIGDKIKINSDPEPGGTGAAQLCRVDKIDQDRTDEATLTVTTDNLVPATPYTPTWPVITPVVQISAPLQYMLAVPLDPSIWGWPFSVALLTTRSAANLAGFYAYFGINDSSPFSELGQQAGFAVRCALEAAIVATDTTVPITELDGESAPDAGLAANTPGGNATAAADDTLLALIAQLDVNGRIALDGDGDPIMEFISISDRATGGGLPAATYNYTVLRGRLGTTAQAWPTTSAVWIVPHGNIMPWRHGLIPSLAGLTAFFRLVSFTAWAVDDTISVPECGVNLPPATAPVMSASIDHVENVFIRSATAPATPTGNGIPTGWNDLPPTGTDQLWMSWSDQAADGTTIGVWSMPVAFGYGIQYSIDGLTAWHPTFTVGDHYYETSTAGGAWSTPIRFVGESATRYWMLALGGIKLTTGSAFVPATITPTAKQQTGTDAVLPYSGRFIIEDSPDGTTWTTRYTSLADESSTTFAPTAGSASVRVSLYLAGGTTALVDQQLVPITADGTNGSSGGSSVLGTASGTATLTPTGMTATSISLTVTTPTLINVQCSGTLQNNGSTNSTFAVVLYMDGSPVGGGCGWNTSGNLNAGNSASFSFFGTPGITAGAHTFALWVGGYPESVTLAANFTIQQ